MESGRSINTVRYMDPYVIQTLIYDASYEQSEYEATTHLIRKLEVYGLEAHEIAIVVERDINDRTFQEIAQKHGFLNARLTSRLYKRAVEKAKQGFLNEKGN